MMMLEIPEILDAAALAAIQAVAGKPELFEDGALTAGWHARARKQNLQAPEQGLVQGVLKKIEQAILQNSVLQAAARPQAMVKLMLSRYEAGMYYGNHTDNALMDGHRTDLSFTLFLSDPNAYDGGALVIDESGGERHVKLPAGSLFLYPSTSLHRVDTVTSGTRTVAVGWLRSFVRRTDQREILFDLDRVVHQLQSQFGSNEPDQHALDLLMKTRSNLLRMWAED